MKKIIHLLLFTLFFSINYSFSQPKLVVGIVVDQMRYEYLERFKKKFGSDGFKRLMKEGFSCENANYNYVPTVTAAGHASIYTGTTPSVHGIINNKWMDRMLKKNVYCVGDKTVQTVGSENASGEMSPKFLLTSTIADELQNAKKNNSKIIGIALKDRAAILPVGKYPTGAYWYDGLSGNWITSTYYMRTLPTWVLNYNKKEYPKKFLSQSWVPSFVLAKYTESDPDNNDAEDLFNGKAKPVFPYDLSLLMKDNEGLGLICTTPFGNTLTKDFAIEAIKNENMGIDTVTDFLSISFSSTDYIGHQFGPHSIEIEDCYIKLDNDIADLLKFLDATVGKQQYLVFLTADHGAADAVNYSKKMKVPCGVVKEKILADSLKKYCKRTYRDSLLLSAGDFFVYLNREKIAAKKLVLEDVQKKVANYLLTQNGIIDAVTEKEIQQNSIQDSIRSKVKLGFNPDRSADVIYTLKPNWLLDKDKGTSHGSPYNYDTHVPLIFFGWRVKKGVLVENVKIIDIASTICSMLDLVNPSGNTGIPIQVPLK